MFIRKEPDLSSLHLLTYAGDGKAFGRDGLRTRAQITKPHGIFCDPNGDIYFSELRGNRLRKIDAETNILVTVAGTGKSGKENGSFPEPTLRIDGAHSPLFDEWPHFLSQIDGNLSLNQLSQIYSLKWKVDPNARSKSNKGLNENIALAQMKHEMLREFTAEEIGWTESDSSSPSDDPANSLSDACALLYQSTGLFEDASSQSYEQNVDKLPNSFSMPEYMVGLGSGELILSDYQSSLIRRYHKGEVTTIAGQAGEGHAGGAFSTSARFHMPRGGCVAPNGDLYLADFQNNVVCIFNPRTNEVHSIGSGVCQTVDGFAKAVLRRRSPDSDSDEDQDGSERTFGLTERPTKVSFASPYQLILRRDQRSFFLCEWTGIRWISFPEHEVRTYAGREPRGHLDGHRKEARFCGIVSLLETPDSRFLLISEYSNQCIRLLNNETGMVSTLTGSTKFTSGFLDGPISRAYLNGPMCMTWNHHGDLLLADSNNHAIRIIHGLCDALSCSDRPLAFPMASYLFEENQDSIFSYFPLLNPSNNNNKYPQSYQYSTKCSLLFDHISKSNSSSVHGVSPFEGVPAYQVLFPHLTSGSISPASSSPSPSAKPQPSSIWTAFVPGSVIQNPHNSTQWIHSSFAFLLSLQNVKALESLKSSSKFLPTRFNPIEGHVDLGKEKPETVSDLFTLITGHARLVFESIILSINAQFNRGQNAMQHDEPLVNFFPTSTGPSGLFIELWTNEKAEKLMEELRTRIGNLLILIWRLQLNIGFAAQLGLEINRIRSKTVLGPLKLGFEWIWNLSEQVKAQFPGHYRSYSPQASPPSNGSKVATKSQVGTEMEVEKSEIVEESGNHEIPWQLYLDHFFTRYQVKPRESASTGPIDDVNAMQVENDDTSPQEAFSNDTQSPKQSSSAPKYTLNDLNAENGISEFRDDIRYRVSKYKIPPTQSALVRFYSSENEPLPSITVIGDDHSDTEEETSGLVTKTPRIPSLPPAPDSTSKPHDATSEVPQEEPDNMSAAHGSPDLDFVCHYNPTTSPMGDLLRYLYHNHVYVLSKPTTLDPNQNAKGDDEYSKAFAPNLLITCDDVHYIHCHDWVLFMKWQWISHVLSSGLEESKERVISLSSSTTMKTDSLAILIQFLYTHSTELNWKLPLHSEDPVNYSDDTSHSIPIDVYVHNRVEEQQKQLENMRMVLSTSDNPRMRLLKDLLENGVFLSILGLEDSTKMTLAVPALAAEHPTSHTFAALIKALRSPFERVPSSLASSFSFVLPFSQLASKKQYQWLVSYLITHLSAVSSHPALAGGRNKLKKI